MKFSSGCLIGILLGVVLAVLTYAGYTFLNPFGKLPLVPASSVADPDLTITVSEQYLNEQLRKGLSARGMNARDLTVNLHAPNRADASMTLGVTILGQSFDVSPHATLHFGVSNGLITIDMDSVDVSGLNVPQDILNQQIGVFKRFAEDQINSEIKRVLANTGLHVVGVESTEAALLIKLSH